MARDVVGPPRVDRRNGGEAGVLKDLAGIDLQAPGQEDEAGQ
jgi:hypothetical protein